MAKEMTEQEKKNELLNYLDTGLFQGEKRDGDDIWKMAIRWGFHDFFYKLLTAQRIEKRLAYYATDRQRIPSMPSDIADLKKASKIFEMLGFRDRSSKVGAARAAAEDAAESSESVSGLVN